MSPRRKPDRFGGGARPGGRRDRPPPDPDDLARSFGYQRVESDSSGEWVVRQVTGAAAGKSYRCPGCDHEIPPGTPHVVAWPGVPEYGAGGGVTERRHWHTACWNARARRRPR